MPYSYYRSVTMAASLAAILSLAAATKPARACAPAPPINGKPIGITDEAAIIVYDKQHGVEHFIRRAVFDTRNRDLGFLVPTPTKPTLAAADPGIFDHLAWETRRATVRQVRRGFYPAFLSQVLARRNLTGAGAPSPVYLTAPPPVRVLDTARVGGYDATVLEADNAEALAVWLKKHGYADSPELRAWLTPYVRNRWKVTAFRVAKKGVEDAPLVLPPVRMTFATDRPFYPYREPAAKPGATGTNTHRLLRIFYIDSGERVQGAIGAGAGKKGVDGNTLPAWPGRVTWSSTLPQADQLARDATLTSTALPAGPLRMTVFDDESSPRPGYDELYFTRATDQSTVTPPPFVVWDDERVPLPVDALTVLGLAAIALPVGIVLRRRRQRAER